MEATSTVLSDISEIPWGRGFKVSSYRKGEPVEMGNSSYIFRVQGGPLLNLKVEPHSKYLAGGYALPIVRQLPGWLIVQFICESGGAYIHPDGLSELTFTVGFTPSPGILISWDDLNSAVVDRNLNHIVKSLYAGSYGKSNKGEEVYI